MSEPRDRTRQWIWAGRLLEVAFLVAVVTLGVLGVEFWLILLVLVPLATAGSLLMVPSRSWWGTGPNVAMADPAVRKNWRRSEIRFALIAFVAIVVVVPLVLVSTGIAPAPS